MKYPAISICIPAYKRIGHLKKLLYSISIQTFKDYEIIITDDSPDANVETFVKDYPGLVLVHYYRNQRVLGTPENWNEAIRKANGVWIKLMHDDDWFSTANSLQTFYEATLKHTDCSFFFSAYTNIFEAGNISKVVRLNAMDKFILKLSYHNLFKKQYVGNPSCTLIKRDINLFYDNNFKWVVDFEYYIRVLKKVKKFYYINEALVNVGINEEQVTKYTFRNPEIEIPENHFMIEKIGFSILRNIFVYDYYWRLYRNLGIRSESEIQKFYQGSLYPISKQMINFQKKIPINFLRIKIISKSMMMANYFLSLFIKD